MNKCANCENSTKLMDTLNVICGSLQMIDLHVKLIDETVDNLFEVAGGCVDRAYAAKKKTSLDGLRRPACT